MNIDFRKWLEHQGFSFRKDQFRKNLDDYDWCAWRPSALSARDCECNGSKMQIIVTPHRYNINGDLYESVDVDVTGEYSGIWYKLQAYSMTQSELMLRLDDIEAALIRAWNALSINTSA